MLCFVVLCCDIVCCMINGYLKKIQNNVCHSKKRVFNAMCGADYIFDHTRVECHQLNGSVVIQEEFYCVVIKSILGFDRLGFDRLLDSVCVDII